MPGPRLPLLLLLATLAAGCPAPGGATDPTRPKASATRAPASATPDAAPSVPNAGAGGTPVGGPSAPAVRTTPRPSPSLPPVATAPPSPVPGTVTTIIGPADPAKPDASGVVDGPAAGARLGGAWSLAIDPAARPPVVYVADSTNSAIRRVSQLAGGGWTVETLAGPGGAKLAIPEMRGIALDPAASPPVLYVASSAGQNVHAVTLGADGAVDRVLAGPPNGPGAQPVGFADGPGADARFSRPFGVALDAKRKRLLVTDYEGARLRAIALDDPASAVTTLAGDGTPGLEDGTLADARLEKPFGLAIQGDRLVVTDGFYRVRTADLAAAAPALRLLAGGGLGYVDGFYTEARFQDPTGVCFDAQGRLVVSDATNHRLRRITKLGDVETLAGTGPATPIGQTLVAGALVDGPADQARFFSPFGVAADAEGAIWILDQRNYALRRLVPKD